MSRDRLNQKVIMSDLPSRAPRSVYRWYVLALLMIIYAVNFIDRQIVTILAPYLKADLGLSDAQVGLLYGTAFAMFYAVFGIPLAKLADSWNRAKTLSLGLLFWSGMTIWSGLAGNFSQLGLARLGVGVGEASASPAAISLLSDYFDKKSRATIIALYSSGMYFGMGASLTVGGLILANWHDGFGLSGWRAAFIIVGLPGIVLGALAYFTIREPVRGAIDGQVHMGDPHPFRAAIAEAGTMMFPWSIMALIRHDPSRRAVRTNLLGLAVIVVASVIITKATGAVLSAKYRAPVGAIAGVEITTNMVQWIAIGLGVYGSMSWIQSIRLRDPVAFKLTVGAKSYCLMAASCALLAVYTYAIGAFVFVYASRYLALQPNAGVVFGMIAAIAGASGTALSGAVSDIVKRRHPSGRIYILVVCMLGFAIATAVQFSTTSHETFFVAYAIALILLSAWPPLMLATAQDLVIARLRGVAFAVQTLSACLVGLGVGPYMVGLISDATGNLRLAILSLLALMPLLLILLLWCARVLPAGEASVIDRARAAGEPI